MNKLIHTNEILSRIYFIRGMKVMLDFHLVALYEVETRALKQQVKRNINRFPKDFMFQLTEREWKEVITICDNPGPVRFSPTTPFAFSEQGVAMLSGVLRSENDPVHDSRSSVITSGNGQINVPGYPCGNEG